MAWTPTFHALRLSAIFVSSTSEKHCCYDLSKRLSIPRMTVFDTLRAMHQAGWLAFEMEEINSSLQNSARRKVLYRITEQGLVEGIRALNAVRCERRAV